jgi:microcystin-dependent protein
MPSPYYYYVYPFGQNADDLTSIPTNAAGDGSVSYYAGWTDPYEYNLLTNPAALPIPRGQMNQLFFDITNNLQEYQQYGTPQWVTGNTVSYPIYSRVYYTGLVYESQISNNTNTPGSDSTWLVTSGNNGGVPIGTIIDYAGAFPPANYLLCDGSAISRTTYAALLSAITQTQNGTTTNTMATVSGLSTTSNMYPGMSIEGVGIPSGTTILSITDSTDIVMSQNATASGTVSIQFFNWGNGNGTTTFNIPQCRRCTNVGFGGFGSTQLGNKTGQTGGEESHTQSISEMPSHNHPGSVMPYQSFNATAGAIAAVETPGGVSGNYPVTVAPQGGGSAFNVIQPSNIVTMCIKYK